MQAELYADVVFAVNFFMDLFILYTTGKIVRKKAKPWRLASASMLAAFLYCLILFAPGMYSIFHNILGSIIIASAAVLSAFAPIKPKQFAICVGTAFLSAFTIGGCCLALSNKIGNVSVMILFAASVISYTALKFIQRRLEKYRLSKQFFCLVKIYFEEEFSEVLALCDTGNTLTDPITGAPVIVAEFNAVKNCLPDYIVELFSECKQDDLDAIIELTAETEFAERIRLIPFRSVGTKSGVLVGFRPDKIEIDLNGKIISKNAIVAIYRAEQRLSPDNEYNALLNPALLEN